MAEEERSGVPVRGLCRKGHVTETFAPKGRVTWKGPCSEDGCDLIVNCRRVAKKAPEPGDKKDEGKQRGPRVRKVDHYVESGDGTKLDGNGSGGTDPGPGADPAPEGGTEREPTFVADTKPHDDGSDEDDGPFGFF